MDKIRLLWIVLFPICLGVIFLTVCVFVPSYYGSPFVLIALFSYLVYLLFLGIEELSRPPKKRGNYAKTFRFALS